MLAPTDEARILPDNLRERLEAAFERGAGHGCSSSGFAKSARRCLRILRTGEISRAATSRCYARLRNQTTAQVQQR
jgi:hypothetical protein